MNDIHELKKELRKTKEQLAYTQRSKTRAKTMTSRKIEALKTKLDECEEKNLELLKYIENVNKLDNDNQAPT